MSRTELARVMPWWENEGWNPTFSLSQMSRTELARDMPWRENEGWNPRYIFIIRCNWLLSPMLNAEISVHKLWTAIQSFWTAIQSFWMCIQKLWTEISDSLFWKGCWLLCWIHLASYTWTRKTVSCSRNWALYVIVHHWDDQRKIQIRRKKS